MKENKNQTIYSKPLLLLLAVVILITGVACTKSNSLASQDTAEIKAGNPHLVRIADFNQPVEIKSAPGYKNLMFVVEQEGVVRVLYKNKKLRQPFLDIRDRITYGGEQGLLSIAFPKDYRKTKRFYVYFNDHQGDIRVEEYRRYKSTRAAKKTARKVIEIPHKTNTNHNGGQLQFLGNTLYFGTGDGGGGGDTEGNAQNLNSLLGKMIRINPKKSGNKPYTIPSSNPFVGRQGARPQIFSYGLRNPFRWSFDMRYKEPRMLIADVGQERFEEINYLPLSEARGANFGWNKTEGFEAYNEGAIPSNHTEPVIALSHDDGYCSVIGGVVVRDKSVPSLKGGYLFSDFCNAGIRGFTPKLERVQSKNIGDRTSQISSFGESNTRRVWVTTLSGPVYKLVE